MRKLTLAACFSALATASAAMPADPGSAGRSARVRAADSRSATLLVQGLERSETIRGLVNTLEQRDVIVYIEMQPALRRRLAGTLTWLSATRAHRYVRISLNPELATDAGIATLGHELQHAVEIANAPEIVSERTLEQFYKAHGDVHDANVNGWDTEAARLTGEDIRRELAGVRSVRGVDSVQQFYPDDWFAVYRRARGMLPP